MTYWNVVKHILEECLSGYELDEKGECVPCQRGHFRSRGMPACQQCVPGKTTPDVAATSEQECLLGMHVFYFQFLFCL